MKKMKILVAFSISFLLVACGSSVDIPEREQYDAIHRVNQSKLCFNFDFARSFPVRLDVKSNHSGTFRRDLLDGLKEAGLLKSIRLAVEQKNTFGHIVKKEVFEYSLTDFGKSNYKPMNKFCFAEYSYSTRDISPSGKGFVVEFEVKRKPTVWLSQSQFLETFELVEDVLNTPTLIQRFLFMENRIAWDWVLLCDGFSKECTDVQNNSTN